MAESRLLEVAAATDTAHMSNVVTVETQIRALDRWIAQSQKKADVGSKTGRYAWTIVYKTCTCMQAICKQHMQVHRAKQAKST